MTGLWSDACMSALQCPYNFNGYIRRQGGFSASLACCFVQPRTTVGKFAVIEQATMEASM